jgi:hypothetical protein
MHDMFRLPRPERNYTEIPNVVFDIIIPTITNLAALKCYLILIRKTWGWEKVGDWLSLSQLIELTKLSRPSVIAGMRWLEERGYIWTARAGKPGKEKIMYFPCTVETEQLEHSVKEGILSADSLFLMFMRNR